MLFGMATSFRILSIQPGWSLVRVLMNVIASSSFILRSTRLTTPYLLTPASVLEMYTTSMERSMTKTDKSPISTPSTTTAA